MQKKVTGERQEKISIETDQTAYNWSLPNYIDFILVQESGQSREFRYYVKSITPDVDLTFEYTSQTGDPHTVNIPIGVQFFWPDVSI